MPLLEAEKAQQEGFVTKFEAAFPQMAAKTKGIFGITMRQFFMELRAEGHKALLRTLPSYVTDVFTAEHFYQNAVMENHSPRARTVVEAYIQTYRMFPLLGCVLLYPLIILA